jgi:SH3 domain protein
MPKKHCWNFSYAENNAKIDSNKRPPTEIPVKKLLTLFFILMATFASAQAALTVYVTDHLDLALRSEENNRGKIIKMLPAGTPLTVLSQNKQTGFTYVRLENGTVGYILTNYTAKELSQNAQVASLRAENATLKTELEALKDSLTPGTTLEKSLAHERDQLSRELSELKQTATSTVQLKNQRDELQERVVNVERELEQLKLENKALEDSANQDWFLYGGMLSIISVILGFLLPKISWRRSRSSGWDSY